MGLLRISLDVDGAAIRRERARVLQTGQQASMKGWDQYQHGVMKRRFGLRYFGQPQLRRHVGVVVVDRTEYDHKDGNQDNNDPCALFKLLQNDKAENSERSEGAEPINKR